MDGKSDVPRPETGFLRRAGPNSGAVAAQKGRQLTRLLILLVAGAFVLRSLVVAPFAIPSSSMMPGLMPGDYLLAAKWPYGYSRHSLPFDLPIAAGRINAALPERGDVVIFKHPIDRRDYIKRVIGLPGDVVSIDKGQLELNGSLVGVGDPANRQDGPVDMRETLWNGRSWVVRDAGATRQDRFGPLIVPAGRLLVLGDNRDNSLDSRFPAEPGAGVGLVEADLLVGRAELIAFSVAESARLLSPASWTGAVRWERIGTRL
jgi:signal peptidase I